MAALGIAASDRVLDLGCGTGADLASLADSAGHVVGLDRSLAMSQKAQSCVAVDIGSVVNGDGHRLPFPDECFDACWIRAVLVHADDPRQVLDEVVRVVRPEGRVVLSEPDHGTHIVTTSEPDVFEKVKAHRRTSFRNPLVGRHLVDLASGSGLQVERFWTTPVVHRSLASARASGGPFDVAVAAAVSAGEITASDAARYLNSLDSFDRRGAFVFAAMACSVSATVRRLG